MRLRLRGGTNVRLAGRPAGGIDVAGDAASLYLPLASRRLRFSDLRIRDGQAVRPGEVLAVDPSHFGVPLLAPRGGAVRVGAVEGHVLIENAARAEAVQAPEGEKRERLVRLGAWPFIEDAHTGGVPDPASEPRAVVVSTLRLEPFGARGDALLAGRLEVLERGLEHLQSLLEYQPTYLVVPEAESALAEEIHETLRGHAWLEVVTVPLTYPFDHPALLARRLGLMAGAGGPVWALRVEGVLAVERALGAGLPVTERVVALGGPAIASPRHVEAPVGYPLEAFLADVTGGSEAARVVNGGALTGQTVPASQRGLDAECAGLTVLAEPRERELLGFTRPGWSRQSYSRCFVSALRRSFDEPIEASLRGEKRACVACGACETVCPANLFPHLIHKALYRQDLDEAERLRVDLCLGCGLCAYVCPSKLELHREFVEAQEALRAEHAAAAEAREAPA